VLSAFLAGFELGVGRFGRSEKKADEVTFSLAILVPYEMLFSKYIYIYYNIYTGWWFGTFFIFPYIGNNHPN
jgi:hypothetical protein